MEGDDMYLYYDAPMDDMYLGVQPDEVIPDELEVEQYLQMLPDEADQYLTMEPAEAKAVEKEKKVQQAKAKVEAAGKAWAPDEYMAMDEAAQDEYLAMAEEGYSPEEYLTMEPADVKAVVKEKKLKKIKAKTEAAGKAWSPDEYLSMDEAQLDEYLAMADGPEEYLAVDEDWLNTQWKLLSPQPWFVGEMTRQKAIELLMDAKAGAFIVRVSQSQPGHYAISTKQYTGKIEHMLILPSQAKKGHAPGSTRYRLGSTSKLLFNTVPKLIAYYIAHPYYDQHRFVGAVEAEQQEGGFNYLTMEP